MTFSKINDKSGDLKRAYNKKMDEREKEIKKLKNDAY
jgi:hypothetical protein